VRGFLLGLILGLLILPVAVWSWLRFGHPPVAVADPPLPFERQIVHLPMHRRIAAEMPKQAGMDPSPANLLLGAEVYRQDCASCHGLYGIPSTYGGHMYPHAPQLWRPHHNGVIGVSDDPPGETYWKVKNGIRLSGMPAFDTVLNDAQMWQVTMLLASAGKPLPTNVVDLLQKPLEETTEAAPAPAAPAAPTPIPTQPLPNE
jgi:mono/diheme cytochrome c family protein